MAFLHPPCSSPTSKTTSRLPFTPLIAASSHLFNPIEQLGLGVSVQVFKFSAFRSSHARIISLRQVLSFSAIALKINKLKMSKSLQIAARVGPVEAKVGVNKPELLPKEFSPVIDVAGFLSDGQEKRLAQEIDNIEKDTGFKLRVLAQNYPDTPGLAIKDFWQVYDRNFVFVADPTFGNILNFKVGA